jgi:hypothetical protein
MAHGYLLHQFLSPISNIATTPMAANLRTGHAFRSQIFDAVRDAFPADRPVWVRVSATDWVDGGWDIEGTVALSKALKDRGCAAIHVSSGGVSAAQKIVLGPGYQVPFARQVRRSGRPADHRRRPDHGTGAGREHHRVGRRRRRRAGAGHALRSALALARGSRARLPGQRRRGSTGEASPARSRTCLRERHTGRGRSDPAPCWRSQRLRGGVGCTVDADRARDFWYSGAGVRIAAFGIPVHPHHHCVTRIDRAVPGTVFCRMHQRTLRVSP